MERTYCIRCKKCLCKRCHPRGACPDRSRRYFLFGALAAPLIKLPPQPLVYKYSFNFNYGEFPYTAVVAATNEAWKIAMDRWVRIMAPIRRVADANQP